VDENPSFAKQKGFVHDECAQILALSTRGSGAIPPSAKISSIRILR
jgi:hypothetical protein